MKYGEFYEFLIFSKLFHAKQKQNTRIRKMLQRYYFSGISDIFTNNEKYSTEASGVKSSLNEGI